MKLKLTPRQQAFLDKLFELYQERREPVHYSAIAERLGVNKFSAYDMLKLLEEKGVAASDYILGRGNVGPGRSMIVFYPTSKAADFLTQLRSEISIRDDWQRIKERVLQRLREAMETDTGEGLDEILARLPDIKSPLAYCAEAISAFLLNLNRMTSHKVALSSAGQAESTASQGSYWPTLKVISAAGEMGLSALAGLSLGSTLSEERPDSSLIKTLVTHTTRFQSYLHELSEEKISMLSRFLEDALAVLDRSANP
jgi:DNA-binding MarR family transcriptional regulator